MRHSPSTYYRTARTLLQDIPEFGVRNTCLPALHYWLVNYSPRNRVVNRPLNALAAWLVRHGYSCQP